MSGQRSQRTNNKLIFVPPGFGVGGGFPTLPVTLFVASSSLMCLFELEFLCYLDICLGVGLLDHILSRFKPGPLHWEC